MILMYIYNEILYILVDWYCSKYSVMGIYMIPHTLEYWATIAHDHIHDLIIMSYINSWSCYENPQDSSYNISFLFQFIIPPVFVSLNGSGRGKIVSTRVICPCNQCCGSAEKKCGYGCGSRRISQCGWGSGCGFIFLLNCGGPSNSTKNR